MKKLINLALAAILAFVALTKPAKAEWNYETLVFISDFLDVFWASFLGEFGVSYTYPIVYPHNGSESTPCGFSEFAHYCINTNTLHLNISEMNTLAFQVGDSAVYFALAHEYGHSVQNHLGLLHQNIPTFALELQADCLAGIFFSASDYVGIMEPGDLEEGMFTALMTGDYNYWHADHHGTPEQRVYAFTSGFFNPASCF